MREITTSELRARTGEVVHAVLQGETIRLTRGGLPVGVLVPPRAYERMTAVRLADLARTLEIRPQAAAAMVTQLVADWTPETVILEAGATPSTTLLHREAALEIGSRYRDQVAQQEAGRDQ